MKSEPTKTNPAFGIIAPTAYLEKYASQSHFHLVLAHLVDTDNTYAEFYAKMSDRGDFIICDNGAFELGASYDPEKLIELGQRCKADAIVLPDYPNETAYKTVDASASMIDAVKNAGFKTMFVPQSKTGDVDDWIKGYVWAAGTPSIDIIGMSILGIPNALNKIHIGYARVVMTAVLIERGLFCFEKYHHYLGLTSGPKLEIPSLIGMNALNSCDSSGPVWAGIHDRLYLSNTDSFQMFSKIQEAVDFNQPLLDDEDDFIQNNIDMTLELFQ